MPLLIIAVLLVVAVILLIPIGIVRRYQVGTSRQRARGWLTALNLAGLAVSAGLFLISAALTSFWVPDAFLYTAGGLLAGGVLGIVGVWLTRWESGLDALHYTPNRALVLTLTLVVTARVLYGAWRGWQSWRAGLSGASWFVEAGLAGSMAAGALLLGYYLAYAIGVRRRLRQHAARPLRRLS